MLGFKLKEPSDKVSTIQLENVNDSYHDNVNTKEESADHSDDDDNTKSEDISNVTNTPEDIPYPIHTCACLYRLCGWMDSMVIRRRGQSSTWNGRGQVRGSEEARMID